MEAAAVVPVRNVEEQPIGGAVSLVRGSPIVDEVPGGDDVLGDDTVAVARRRRKCDVLFANFLRKDRKGEPMKTVTKTLTAFLGMLCLLALAGCPKKAVVTPEQPTAKPVSEETDAGVEFRWNLAAIHFDFDRSDIRPRDATILQGDYDQMQTAAARNQRPGFTIEGYCDPVGTAEYNMALGMRRAEAAKSYLVRLGVSASQLSTISYGEEKLVTQDETQFELNRRCEFRVAK